jgi:hypothetical protein
MKKQIEFTNSAWKFYTEQSEKVRNAFDVNIMELSESGELHVPNRKPQRPKLKKPSLSERRQAYEYQR